MGRRKRVDYQRREVNRHDRDVLPRRAVAYAINKEEALAVVLQESQFVTAELDIARPGERIFVTSFGSGAGSDAFSIKVLDRIEDIRCNAPSVRDYIGDAEYLDYAMYAKHKGKLRI